MMKRGLKGEMQELVVGRQLIPTQGYIGRDILGPSVMSSRKDRMKDSF